MNASEARALALASVPAQRERTIRDIDREIERASRHALESIALYLHKGSNHSKDSKIIHHVPLDEGSRMNYEDYLTANGFEIEMKEVDERGVYRLWISWEEE